MTSAKLSLESLIGDLRRLGVAEGDVLLVRADLLKVGRTAGGGQTILDALLAALGTSGTLVTLAFTKQFPFFRVDPEYVYDQTTRSTAGALTRLALAHPDCRRSRHPVNSFAAIGPKAEEILADHDASALTYLPMQKIIDLDGKMLVSGCVASSPGFTTVHYAQEVLGLSRRSLVRNKVRVYYRTDAGVRLFRKASIGGCSDGFSSFYSHYVAQEKLVTGLFGSAYSILIRARDAYALELELLRKNPRVALCANPLCLSCRATWLYNKRDMPGYWVRAAIAHTIGALRSWRQKRGIGQTEEP